MKLKVGKKSVDIASKYFRDHGFSVFGDEKKSNSNGIDLYIEKFGRVYSVEVKSVCRGTRAYRVKPCCNAKRNDYIAMVFKSTVIVQPMSDHLAVCSKDGSRSVTKLIEMLIAEGKVRQAK